MYMEFSHEYVDPYGTTVVVYTVVDWATTWKVSWDWAGNVRVYSMIGREMISSMNETLRALEMFRLGDVRTYHGSGRDRSGFRVA